jgi:hypothetical protein
VIRHSHTRGLGFTCSHGVPHGLRCKYCLSDKAFLLWVLAGLFVSEGLFMWLCRP